MVHILITVWASMVWIGMVWYMGIYEAPLSVRTILRRPEHVSLAETQKTLRNEEQRQRERTQQVVSHIVPRQGSFIVTWSSCYCCKHF